MVDLQREKFRAHLPDVDDEDRDASTVNGDDDINDFAMIEVGNYIEIDWPHADIFFPCKILSWTPLPERKRRASMASTASLSSLEIEPQRKRRKRDAAAKKGKPERDRRDKESSSKRRTKKEAKKKKKKKSKSLAEGKADAKMSSDERPSEETCQSDDSNRDSEESVENMENELFSDVSYERAPVKRSGHGIPLYKEPEDDSPGNREITESDESGDEDDAYIEDPYQTTHKLSFEEQVSSHRFFTSFSTANLLPFSSGC